MTKRSVGNKRLYRIKTDNAYYPELRSIALKTLGGIETIAKEIQGDPAIGFAAVFGSFARDPIRIRQPGSLKNTIGFGTPVDGSRAAKQEGPTLGQGEPRAGQGLNGGGFRRRRSGL